MTIKKKITKKKTVKKKATVKKKKATKRLSPKDRAAANKKKLENTPEEYRFGRPTEYNRDFPELIYNACVSGECLTLASICCKLEIARDTYYNWIEKYKDFSYAIKRGTEFRKHHMEEKGFKGINRGKDFNAIPWLFLTKNMFPDEYKDKQEIDLGNRDGEPFNFAFDLSKKPSHRE